MHVVDEIRIDITAIHIRILHIKFELSRYLRHKRNGSEKNEAKRTKRRNEEEEVEPKNVNCTFNMNIQNVTIVIHHQFIKFHINSH